MTIYWIQVASPRSGILCRVWETISRDQENGSHLLDPGCLPGSSTLYRNWGTIHRDREHGSHLLDPGCLTQIWYIMQKLGGKFERPGTWFSFTGSELPTQIQQFKQKLGYNFQRRGTRFSFTGARLSYPYLAYYAEIMRIFSVIRNTVLIY